MFRRKPQIAVHPEWLIVGLGNPGPEYKGTRHNVGFEAIDLIAERHKIKLDKGMQQARVGLGLIDGHPVALVKPLTFMNNSGRSVAPIARNYGVKPDRILVIADDLDMVVGRTRLKPKGSAGGHNGHKSIIASIGSEEYPRLKIGIGTVDRENTVDHVLGKFNPEEQSDINAALAKIVQAVEAIVESGVEPAMNIVNVGGNL